MMCFYCQSENISPAGYDEYGRRKWFCSSCKKSHAEGSKGRKLPISFVCFQCGSLHLKRYGKLRGIQKYQCLDCNRIFLETVIKETKIELCPFCGSPQTQRSGRGMGDIKRQTKQRWSCLDCQKDFFKGNDWSLEHSSCIRCQTTTLPHHGKGYCHECYPIVFEENYRKRIAQWKKENKEKTQHYDHVRRTRIRAVNMCTSQEYEQFALSMKACVCCGSTERLSVDHKIPLSRGGLHVVENFVCLCINCNSKKGTKTWEEFYGN